MALRAVKPEKIQKRLKAFFYGGAGVGKTTAAIAFPSVYLIDTERGCENDEYVEMLQKNNGAIFQVTDFDELMVEVKALLTEKHDFKTLVIDPMTTLYNDLVDKEAIKHGTDFGRHYSAANKRMKYLMNLLMKLDLNVIITAHSKNEYGQNLAIVGTTYDCFKKMDHMFDLAIEAQRRGKDRVGLIKKSRIAAFPDGETIAFSYDEIAKRYGHTLLEKESTSFELATVDQVTEFNHLVAVLHIEETTIIAILKKEGVESIEYLSKDYMQKCIDRLKSKIRG